MVGTYSQIYIQYVFSVKGRENLLQKPWRDEVFKYISGIIKGKNQKPIIVNGVADHVHVFVGLKPAMRQEGYGVFSYAHSQIKSVYNYIENQEKHHLKKTFKKEYIDFLQRFEIEYNEKYLFEWLD